MTSLSVRCAFPLALSLLLAAAGCNKDTSGIPLPGTGGTGGVSPAGRGGRGGSSTGGTSGTGGGGGASGTSGSSGSTGGTMMGGSGPTPTDGPSETGGDVADAAEGGMPDGPMADIAPMPDMTQPDMPIVPGGCGNYVAAANTTGGAEGIVVAPDGTLYFSQAGQGQHIGRIRPGGPVERTFAMVGPNVLGITYDPKRKLIYAGRRGMGTTGPAVMKIDVSGPTPLVGMLAVAGASINGVTLGEDEAVYYTEESARNVRRVTYFGQSSLVNASALPGNPNGLAFGPDQKLYIVYFSGSNQITRLTLTNGGETGRDVFLNNVGAAGADGIAFDDMGRVYVTAGGQLRRFSPQMMGMPRMDFMMASNGANIEFGIGALNCNDVYVGSGNAGIRRHTLADARGANVPWHRPSP